jgi:hypothetical protein
MLFDTELKHELYCLDNNLENENDNDIIISIKELTNIKKSKYFYNLKTSLGEFQGGCGFIILNSLK